MRNQNEELWTMYDQKDLDFVSKGSDVGREQVYLLMLIWNFDSKP